ncbi:MAG TPA: nitroreductase family protein, partial [Acidimicrobiia bacterium]|nr:nitroreductase family protein [Acidimicrobiia bacterium]
MEFGEVVLRRRMVRNFEDRPVPAEALQRILDHARRAPSAGHTQGASFLVLVGPEQ